MVDGRVDQAREQGPAVRTAHPGITLQLTSSPHSPQTTSTPRWSRHTPGPRVHHLRDEPLPLVAPAGTTGTPAALPPPGSASRAAALSLLAAAQPSNGG
ncbi:hypothetical protein [Nocardia sp. NRRL S-836]|uniref:hypothetical protein n=1 Tax=Nocardia sp. NRRL S-836 TaxID=1519492 RepID=UPI0006AF7D88|nr:hypothetical protein [Nocardia sp. NRRL S-836]KOV90048.1 hypothetical protein ADL03_01390 [Nocardia sp. NRRL S-836]